MQKTLEIFVYSTVSVEDVVISTGVFSYEIVSLVSQSIVRIEYMYSDPLLEWASIRSNAPNVGQKNQERFLTVASMQ